MAPIAIARGALSRLFKACGAFRALGAAALAVACLVFAGCGGSTSAPDAPRGGALQRVVHCQEPERGAVDVRRDEDLVVLVHGCNSSISKFENLAQEFEARGQQVVCFSYDDRDSLISAARELNVALDALRGKLGSGHVILIGHSQGGLIARQAATAVDQSPVQVTQLVTIASPFSGIRSARDCGSLPLHIFTFGITVGVCQIAAGRKWTEIHGRAPFMVSPPALAPEVKSHLAVLTDEVGACRVRDDAHCEENHVVFSLQEQALDYLEDARVRSQVVRAGHAEIVGEGGHVPDVLIALLEEEGILRESSAGDDRLGRLVGGSVSHAGVLSSGEPTLASSLWGERRRGVSNF